MNFDAWVKQIMPVLIIIIFGVMPVTFLIMIIVDIIRSRKDNS